MPPIAVFTTVATRTEAEDMAHALVERGLAACAQISQIDSIYTWKDSVHTDTEFRILFKTVDERYAEVESAIRELHAYEVPAIYALRFEHAFGPYAQWIEESCRR